MDRTLCTAPAIFRLDFRLWWRSIVCLNARRHSRTMNRLGYAAQSDWRSFGWMANSSATRRECLSVFFYFFVVSTVWVFRSRCRIIRKQGFQRARAITNCQRRQGPTVGSNLFCFAVFSAVLRRWMCCCCAVLFRYKQHDRSFENNSELLLLGVLGSVSCSRKKLVLNLFWVECQPAIIRGGDRVNIFIFKCVKWSINKFDISSYAWVTFVCTLKRGSSLFDVHLYEWRIA